MLLIQKLFLFLILSFSILHSWGGSPKRMDVNSMYTLSAELKHQKENFHYLKESKKFEFIHRLYKSGYLNIGAPVSKLNIYIPYISYFYETNNIFYIEKIKKLYKKARRIEKYNFTLAIMFSRIEDEQIKKNINELYDNPEAYKYLRERYPRYNMHKIANNINNTNKLELIWSSYFVENNKYFIFAIERCSNKKYSKNGVLFDGIAMECKNSLLNNKEFY